MEIKKVYQTDENGYFKNSISLDENDISPLDGELLIPGGCTEIVPPNVEQGQRAKFVNGEWQLIKQGLKCYSDDGLAIKIVDELYAASTGEHVFDHDASAAELTLVFPLYTEKKLANEKTVKNVIVQSRLSELDVFIPRGLEDTWTALTIDVTKLPAIQQERLSKKVSLRACISAINAATTIDELNAIVIPV